MSNIIETCADWDIRRDPECGIWATDPDDNVSVWVEDGDLHFESLEWTECDIPLAVIDRLRALAKEP